LEALTNAPRTAREEREAQRLRRELVDSTDW
jgi:hypothetical protein